MPDPKAAERIIERCAAAEPRLEGAKVLRHEVGLRPGRPTIRVERDGDVIHNYGHGGVGVSMSWGCAREVLELVRSRHQTRRHGAPASAPPARGFP